MKNKSKQITYISIMVMVMGGTIGAGIFFKNKTLSQMAQGNFGIVMATWGVGIFAMLALALSIIEISSAQKTNKGILEWVKIFTPRWVYKSSSRYFMWIFIPVTLFTMPIYFVNTLEDAGIPLTEEWHVILISFLVFVWFMITNLISLKFSEISQWIITVVQTIPLIVFPIIGFINSGDVVGGDIWHKVVGHEPNGLTGASPWMATIAGISAISFAFDGFYASASLRNEMDKPKKLSVGLVGGVIGVSVVYLFLTIGFNIAGDGEVYGMEKYIPPGVYKMLMSFIAVGILGVINSYSMSSPRQFKAMHDEKEIKVMTYIQKIIYRSKTVKNDEKQLFMSGWWLIIILTIIFFAIFGPLGSYGYQDNSFGYGGKYGGNHLYGFADILTNFTSLLVFVILAAAIVGGLVNRKTQKITVLKSKWFISMGIASVSIIFVAAIYMVIATVVDMTGYNGSNISSSITVFVVFIIIIALTFVPQIFDTKWYTNFKKKIKKTRH